MHTCLSVSKDTSVVSLEGILQHTAADALKDKRLISVVRVTSNSRPKRIIKGEVSLMIRCLAAVLAAQHRLVAHHLHNAL